MTFARPRDTVPALSCNCTSTVVRPLANNERRPPKDFVTYVNSHFAETDLEALHALIQKHPFGLLIAPGRRALATHIPFVLHRLEGEYGTLVAHTPRADPIAEALDGTTELLAIFTGPSAYVRSRWYVNPGLPTYNFVAVHAYGRARPLTGREATLAHLSELVDVHEAPYADAFDLREAADDYLAPLLDHIAPFSMEIEHLEGKVKLSQNRAARDRAAVVDALHARGADDDRALAAKMQQYPYRSNEPQPLIAAGPGSWEANHGK